MPDHIITARVQRMERMPSSSNGNPRFRIYLSNGQNYPTQPDAAFGYAAENPEFIGTWQERQAGSSPLVDFHVNGRGQITYGKPAQRVYVDNGDGPSTIGLEYERLNPPWSGGEEPVVTARQFEAFIDAWRQNDPNGTWGHVVQMPSSGELWHIPNDTQDPDQYDRFSRVGTTPAGDPLYAITGWTFTTEPNEEGR